MLRGFLRVLAYSLAFWFVYRVVVGAFRSLTQDTQRRPSEPQPPPREPKSSPPPDYGDVRDARFKDLPKDPPQ
ncbi:MAG TPA: hypothetical protein VMH23_05150 [Bacteroidota bacterium]|nr:hypothetical protein [Bacteroidota bacterium]